MNQGRHAVLLQELERVTRRAIEPLGLEVVELSLRGSSRKRVLRLDIDRAGPEGVGLEDCQRASGAIGEALETDDLIESAYTLEVSSPGIDRPIESEDDIRRNTGRRVDVRLKEPIDESLQFIGVLVGGEKDWIELQIDTDENSEDSILRIARDRVESIRQDTSF